MARYHDPKTGKTIEASNMKEAKKKLASKPKPKAKAKED